MNLRRATLCTLATLVLAALLAACGGTPTDPDSPVSFVETRIPPTLEAPLFREARLPVTRDNAAQIAYLGRLDPPEPIGTVFAAALAPDSTRLVGLTADALAVWDVLTGQLVMQTARYDASAVYYAPDKTELYLITPFPDALQVTVLDAETGAQTATFIAHDQPTTWTYNTDEGWLAVGGADGTLRIWDPLTRAALVTLEPTDGVVRPLTALVFLPGGERLAAADTGFARVWDWRNRVVTAEVPLDGDQVTALVASPGAGAEAGTLVLATQTDARLWQYASAADDATRRLDTGGAPEIIAFAPDGTRLLAGGPALGFNLWNFPDLTLAGRLPEATGSRVSAAFTADGLLATTALTADLQAVTGDVSLWDTGQAAVQTIPRAVLPVDAPIFRAVWTDDQRLLVLFSTTGPVYLWGIP